MLAAAASLETGCHAAGSETLLRFWAMGGEGEAVGALVPEFERRHPGLRVDIEEIPWSAAHEKLLTAFAGRVLPDACQLGNTWIPEFQAIGALQALDERAGRSAVVQAGDYFPGVWATNLVAGRLYGVPWYVDTRLLYYRSDLLERAGFAQAPRSWAEWARCLGALKRLAGDGYAILLPLTEFEPLLALALQQDEPLLRDGDRYGNFGSAGFRRALDFYLGMFRDQWAPSLGSAQISNVWNEFARGLFSQYISGPWNIAEFKRRLPAELQRAWMTAPLPGPEGPGASIAGGASLVVFRDSERADAAWRWIEYLSEDGTQRAFHEITGNLPPRRSTWDHPDLAADPYAAAFRAQLERVRPAPRVPEWERIASEMQSMAEELVRNRGLDVEQALRALDVRVDAILAKRRWMMQEGRAS